MALTTTTSETMTDSSITMMTALDDLSSVVVALPVVESAEAPGDLASHGEKATTLATQVSEKVTTQATQVSEKVTTQVSEKVTLATIPASEKAMDTEWQRKPTFLSQFSRNPVASNQSVSIIFTNCNRYKILFLF